MIYGAIGGAQSPGLSAVPNNTVDIRQFGVATQTEFRAIEDKLDLQFGFGWASGDPWAYSTSANGVSQGALNPGPRCRKSSTAPARSRRSASTPTTASTSSSSATS